MLRGFGEWLEEDPRGRLCMLNRRNYTRNGHVWNPMPDTGVGKFEGGVRIFGRGVRKKGGSDEPLPPGYGPGLLQWFFTSTIFSHIKTNASFFSGGKKNIT